MLLCPRPKLVSISKVIEGILVICPVPTSKKMCGKMWLKQRKARPRELYTISNRYAKCYVQHDSYIITKAIADLFWQNVMKFFCYEKLHLRETVFAFLLSFTWENFQSAHEQHHW